MFHRGVAVASVAAVVLQAIFGLVAGGFSPPREILGRCKATCVLEKGSGYPCPYTPTYPVWFWPNGTFNWVSPYRTGSIVETGSGEFLTSVKERRWLDGQWEAQWFGGNHLFTPASEKNVTHCACYYAKGAGMRKAWYLSNYGIATIENSSHLPVQTVCEPHFKKLQSCPPNNESAFELWGAPWIEAYLGCDPVDRSHPMIFM